MPVTDFTDAVTITGSQDTDQLVVQAHTTQTKALQEWQDSSDNPLARVTGDGRLHVGSFDSGMMTTNEALIEAHRLDTDTTKPKRGLHVGGMIGGVLASMVAWVVQELTLKGTNGISALHTALRVHLRNETTGVGYGELRGADVEVANIGTSGSASLPETTGLRVAVSQEQYTANNSVYAIRVELNGTPETSYAFFAPSGRVVLGGIGTGLVRANGELITDQVHSDDLSEGSVTSDKIGFEAVTESKLAPAAVTEDKLGDDAVTTAKIQEAAITQDKLSENSVSGYQLVSGAVTNEKISDQTITGGKLAYHLMCHNG